jgi:hypothetical protein
VFQDGPCGSIAPAPRARRCQGPRTRALRPRPPPRRFRLSRGESPRWPAPRADGGPVTRSACGRGAPIAAARLPLNNFKHFLTLFPKFFSSFPRGTCSLSVSRQYLALDGIYHPIRAALPSNPTRGQRLVMRQGPRSTGLSPSLTSRSRELGLGPPLRALR